jgi:hypothetical protein
MAELEELRRKFDEKIKFYEDQYRELQMCFEGRPSRPDDIELINNLQKECNTKNEELALAEERMKFFRQELINREDNYNKIFNANPIVGTMDPLQKKVCSFWFLWLIKNRKIQELTIVNITRMPTRGREAVRAQGLPAQNKSKGKIRPGWALAELGV